MNIDLVYKSSRNIYYLVSDEENADMTVNGREQVRYNNKEVQITMHLTENLSEIGCVARINPWLQTFFLSYE